MNLKTKGLISTDLPIRCRSHILLEPPKKAGDNERIVRVYEEWGDNVQINDQTLFWPLGNLHRYSTCKYCM